MNKHYKPLQVLEIVFTVANNNSTTRWTDGLGIPQEEVGGFFRPTSPDAVPPAVLKSFLTPTSKQFETRKSPVAPVRETKRPALESREQVEAALAECRKRTPRLPLVDEAAARKLLPEDWDKGPLPEWVRLLTNFPVAGTSRVLSQRAGAEKGTLDKKLRAQIAWIAARQDRAWYALGHARQRLAKLGVGDKDVWNLDGSWEGFSAGEKAVFALARKLTAYPHQVADEDIAAVRKHYPDKQVAEVVYQICNAAFFNRLTEAAGLRLEE